MLTKVGAVIYDELSYIYCHNCEHEDGECDDCNRKQMGWSVSKDVANDLAEKIIETSKDE